MRWWIVAMVLVGCSGDPSSSQLFGPKVERIEIEIDYMADAEPYTGFTEEGRDTWDLFRVNLDELFDYRTEIVVPSELHLMSEVPSNHRGSYTRSQVLDIASKYREGSSTSTVGSFYVVFVDGYYHDGNEVVEGVVGVSYGGTSVIAMFKPVVAGLEYPNSEYSDLLRRFTEQTTLIHELGHAVGMVDNGVAMVHDHRDRENGKHCTNAGCVMYWQTHPSGDLLDWVRQYVTSGDAILFKSDCLLDGATAADGGGGIEDPLAGS